MRKLNFQTTYCIKTTITRPFSHVSRKKPSFPFRLFETGKGFFSDTHQKRLPVCLRIVRENHCMSLQRMLMQLELYAEDSEIKDLIEYPNIFFQYINPPPFTACHFFQHLQTFQLFNQLIGGNRTKACYLGNSCCIDHRMFV